MKVSGKMNTGAPCLRRPPQRASCVGRLDIESYMECWEFNGLEKIASRSSFGLGHPQAQFDPDTHPGQKSKHPSKLLQRKTVGGKVYDKGKAKRGAPLLVCLSSTSPRICPQIICILEGDRLLNYWCVFFLCFFKARRGEHKKHMLSNDRLTD